VQQMAGRALKRRDRRLGGLAHVLPPKQASSD
jgi:hypothetical protein